MIGLYKYNSTNHPGIAIMYIMMYDDVYIYMVMHACDALNYDLQNIIPTVLR